MNIGLASLIVTCGVNLTLGAVIFSRNKRLPANIAFLCMSLAITLWTVANYITNAHHATLTPNDIGNRLAFVSGYLVVACGLVFTYYFPDRRRVNRLEQASIIGISVVTLILSATTFIAGTVSLNHGVLTFGIGRGIALYILSFLILIMYIARNLLSFSRHAEPAARLQARFILFAFSVTAPLGLSINLIIPAFVSNWQFTEFGPLITMVLVIIISYAMIKHGLFDIRLVIARSAAYLASLVVIAFLFGLIAFGIVSAVFNLHTPFRAQAVILLATMLVALVFSRVKTFFDRITNQLFYRDAYNAQRLFDDLNQVLVSNTNLDSLLKHTADIITKTMMLDWCVFVIAREGGSARTIGSRSVSFTATDMTHMDTLIQRSHNRMVMIDTLDMAHDETAQLLGQKNVAVVLRLAPHAKQASETLGYILLGPKKSGNEYVRDDMHLLDNVADELIIAIQNSLHYEEIQHFNETLQARVNVATKQLQVSNAKLKALDATKDEFITMASHQLRTPLTSVKGYLSMVLEGDAGKLNAQQAQLLNQSYVSAQRMVFLIADLLNLSRLNTGKFLIESTPTDLARIVEEEVSQLIETAKARDVALSYTRPETFPRLMLDETKIRQVVMNFIDNAIYYTPAGGSITVSLTETQSSIEYKVVDTGIGVPRAEQRHLFSKFYRAENAKRARPDGTGLGLFMAKKVIAAQGGAVVFESEENKGSSFGFRFSKAQHLAPIIKAAGKS